MKTIGLLGGTSWESTVEYYKIINKKVSEFLGSNHSAKISMFSIDFNEISRRVEKNDFSSLYEFILETSRKIQAGGADCLVIGANTLHMFADDIQKNIDIPLIHIADATAAKIKENKFSKAGLLGTKPTMEMPFYKDRLKEKHGIEVIVPSDMERDYIHEKILVDFFKGSFTEIIRNRFLEIISDLSDKGAECVILGCTEIPLLLSQKDTKVPLFDTLEIHASAAVDFAVK